MENHIKFHPGQQIVYLKEVQQRSGLKEKALARIAHTVPRNFQDWKREKITMTAQAALTFSEKFGVDLPEDIEVMQQRWKQHRSTFSKKGGIALVQKYGNPATLEGRQKGGRKTLSILRAKGIIPKSHTYNLPNKFSVELAEFVGILLGDGGITLSQATITLNSIADRDYLHFVKKLANSLFQSSFKSLVKKNCNAVVIYFNSIFIVNYLHTIGLKSGNKVQLQVDVPEWIRDSIAYKTACLRGLMDTDGGIFLHKYKIKNKQYVYKKVCFVNRSIPLLNFVFNTLLELGFTPKMITRPENKRVWLYNKSETEKYIKLVGTHNTRLLKHQN